MIHTHCTCGHSLSLPEAVLNRPVTCHACGRTLRTVAAVVEPLFRADDFTARLVIESGPCRIGEQMLLGGSRAIEIGSVPTHPIFLTGHEVAPHHARLVKGEQGWRLEAHECAYGVQVNGTRVQAADLHDQDAIRIGPYTLRFACSAITTTPHLHHTHPTIVVKKTVEDPQSYELNLPDKP